MQSMIVAGLILLIAVALPFAIVAARKSARKGGRGGRAGAVLAIGLAFSILFDPRKQEVIERIGKSENEGEDRNKQGEV